MAQRPFGDIRGTRTSGRMVQIAIIIFGVFLLLITVNGIVQVRLVTSEQEKLLPGYLRLVGETVAGVDGYKDYFFFLEFLTDEISGLLDETALEDYVGTAFWERVAGDLAAAEAVEFVKSAEILSSSGLRVMNSAGEVPAADNRGLYLGTEREAIQQALGGETVVPEKPRNDLRRAIYIPIRAADGHVFSLLRLEADAEKFVGLELLRRRLLLSFAISGFMLVVLYFATVRLMRRSIEVEKSMARADRLRAVGTMTAGIAHEIRNPLGILTLEAEEIEAEVRHLPVGQERTNLERLAQDIKSELRRVRKLTENFLSFSGASDTASFTPQRINAGQIVSEVVRMWEKGLDRSKRELLLNVEKPAEGELEALFSEDRLRQILLNLLRNADEAMGATAGCVTVGATNNGRSVIITVSDTGPGIDSQLQSQIFDPFFTTRAEGTGLGLSLSRALAESAGGGLTVHSAKGKGAQFVLTLKAPGKT